MFSLTHISLHVQVVHLFHLLKISRKIKLTLAYVVIGCSKTLTLNFNTSTLLYLGEAIPPENEDILTQLKFIHDQLQKILTEYEVLIQILLAFFKNLVEVSQHQLIELQL